MKKLVSYTPFFFLLFLIIGIVLQYYGNFWTYSKGYLISLLTFLLLILFVLKLKNLKIAFTILNFFTFILIGVTAVFIQNPKNYANYYYKNYQQDNSVILTIHSVLKSGSYYDKYIATISQVQHQKTIGRVLVNIQKDSTKQPLKVNQRLLLVPEFKELIPPLNPHQFNYKAYLAKQHIYHQLFTDYQHIKILKNSTISFVSLSATVRNNIQQALQKHHFSKDEYAVINALLLGQRQEISKELLEDYTQAGAIHILAISGLHIGILVWILSFVFKPIEHFKKGRIIKAVLIVCLLWCFAFIAGLSASVVRAVTMFSFITIAITINRKQHIEHALLASMFLLLLVNPLFLFDVGFQLSYLAVFGIIWVQPILYTIWKPKFFLVNKLWQLLTVSIAAQAGILPLSLYYFNQFPSLFIISNLAIIPFLGGILLMGILVILLALTNSLPYYVTDIYGYIISLMNTIVEWVASKESFLLTNISLSIPKMITWYLIVITLYQLIIKRKPLQIIYFLTSIILLQNIIIIESYKRQQKKEFVVFHKSRKVLLGNRNGKNTTLYHNIDETIVTTDKVINSYKTHEKLSISLQNKTPNIFQIDSLKILVIDSLGIYNLSLNKPIVILQHSPKINLNRLINKLHPIQIIADGSNYKTYINQWKATCQQQKTPFHYTGQNGAFLIKQ